jgi:hypothetical protein
MRLCFAALIVIACCGCGAFFTGMGHDAATGAVNAVTSDDSKKKLSDLTTEATKAARDEALGQTTDDDIQKLIKNAGITTRAELEALITATFQARLRQTIRLAVDEMLGTKTLADADALREELLGKPFQDDLNAALDAAGPHLATAAQKAVQASLVPINTETNTLKTTADAEAAKWKPIAIGFGIGGACLLACLVVLLIVLRSHRKIIESHQKVIESLARRGAPQETE